MSFVLLVHYFLQNFGRRDAGLPVARIDALVDGSVTKALSTLDGNNLSGRLWLAIGVVRRTEELGAVADLVLDQPQRRVQLQLGHLLGIVGDVGMAVAVVADDVAFVVLAP